MVHQQEKNGGLSRKKDASRGRKDAVEAEERMLSKEAKMLSKEEKRNVDPPSTYIAILYQPSLVESEQPCLEIIKEGTFLRRPHGLRTSQSLIIVYYRLLMFK